MKDWKMTHNNYLADVINPKLRFAYWEGHRDFVYDLLAFVKPKQIVELGSQYGCSLFTFCQSVLENQLETRIDAIDFWQGNIGAEISGEEVLEIVRRTVDVYFAEIDIHLHPMKFDQAIELFDDGTIDILHIDGSHKYEDVDHDFNMWMKKLSKDGIILFHDIYSDMDQGSCDHWKMIKEKYSAWFEFKHSCGLGILFPKGLHWYHAIKNTDFEKTYHDLYYYRALYEYTDLRFRELCKNYEDRYISIEHQSQMIDERDKEIQSLKSLVKDKENELSKWEMWGGNMRRAAWVLPEFIEGSGGHRTMFQNIQCLADHGYSCDVYVEDKGQVKSSEELRELTEKYFGKCSCRFFLGYDLREGYDIVFATAWYTAKIVRDYKGECKKAYFIQDFEPLFNPMGDAYLMACASYCYGLHPITIGRWLANKVESEYHTPAQFFDFCADETVYQNFHKKREKAICFIYQPEKLRRCSEIGIEALGIVKYLRPDVKIYLFGSDFKGKVWFEHKNLKIISIKQCNELYNRCSVGLCISSSNPSRIPFEMMAAGLPVVDLYMENNLYDMPQDGVSLAHYTPESIAEALIDILDHPNKAKQMSRCGQEYMKIKTLDYGFGQFYQAVENIIEGNDAEKGGLKKIYKEEPVIADVVRKTLTVNDRYQIDLKQKDDTLLGRLKQNPHIRNNKLVQKVYYKMRGLGI